MRCRIAGLSLLALLVSTAGVQAQAKDSTRSGHDRVANAPAPKAREAGSGMATGRRVMGHDAVERAIAAQNRQWLQAIQQKDTAAIRSLMAPGTVALPPNGPAMDGPDAVVGLWGNLVGMPGLKLDFSTKDLVVAASGDLAVETGTWTMQADGQNGEPMNDNGKYVVVWQKVGSQWKVLRDIWNSDHQMTGM